MANIIGIFDDREEAENAVNEIREAGITEDKISIVAKEDQFQQEKGGGQEGGEDLTTGATTGGTLGGLAGLMAGAGALTIPGIGPILAAGPLAAGLSGVAAGGLAGSLVDLGVDRERGQFYEDEVKRGSILATVEADDSKVDDVTSYLKRNGAREVETH
ncbi:MAG: general stress protein [Bacillota bacterium]